MFHIPPKLRPIKQPSITISSRTIFTELQSKISDAEIDELHLTCVTRNPHDATSFDPSVISKAFNAILLNQHIKTLTLSSEFFRKYVMSVHGGYYKRPNIEYLIQMRALETLKVDLTGMDKLTFNSLMRYLTNPLCTLKRLEIIGGGLTAKNLRDLQTTIQYSTSLETYAGCNYEAKSSENLQRILDKKRRARAKLSEHTAASSSSATSSSSAASSSAPSLRLGSREEAS